MKLTIVGSSPSCPNAGGACSGYLFQADDTALLVDCGPGVVAQLQRYLPYWDLSAVVITHLHADHVLDLIPLWYGFKYSPVASSLSPPQIYLPPKGQAKLGRLIAALDPQGTPFNKVFDVAEYDPRAGLQVGSLRVTFKPVLHYIPAWGMRVSEVRGKATGDGQAVIAFSADTGPCDGLMALAQDADLFLCEVTLPERSSPGEWGHMTPQEAGEVARAAGVRRLVLTHVWQELDRDQLIRQAQAHFGGPVEIAVEGRVYEF